MRPLLPVLALVAIVGTGDLATAAEPRTAGRVLGLSPGEDWSLPDAVRPTSGFGLGWVNGPWVEKWTRLYPVDDPDPDAIYFNQWISLRWADANPAPGVFDWGIVDRQVRDIEQTPHLGFAFWLKGYARCEKHSTGTYEAEHRMVPRWLEEQGKVAFLPDGTAVSWDPDSGYLEAYGQFLQALAARYADHPRFCWVECRYIDRSWGEGGFRGGSVPVDDAKDGNERKQRLREGLKDQFHAVERDHHMNPENLERFLRAFFELHAQAFKGRERAVVLQTFGNCLFGGFMYEKERYAPVSRRAWQYGLRLGFGGRDGYVEVWLNYLSGGYGISFDANGYMLMDETHPAVAGNRIWHTENEEYPPHGCASKFGPIEMTDYRYRAANLRALQMRRNWMCYGTSSRWPLEEQPDLTRYVQLSLGKTVDTSPDAWCWLREGYVWGSLVSSTTKSVLAAKNFERWLFQRDVAPDGATRPAAKVTIEGMNQFWSARPHEFQARKTDQTHGQNAIYFQAERAWYGPTPQTARLFVGYHDADNATWCVEFDTPAGRHRTPIVAQKGTNQWTTAVLELPDLLCRGSFAGDMDLRLLRLDGADPVIRMVRLVKWPTP